MQIQGLLQRPLLQFTDNNFRDSNNCTVDFDSCGNKNAHSPRNEKYIGDQKLPFDVVIL